MTTLVPRKHYLQKSVSAQRIAVCPGGLLAEWPVQNVGLDADWIYTSHEQQICVEEYSALRTSDPVQEYRGYVGQNPNSALVIPQVFRRLPTQKILSLTTGEHSAFSPVKYRTESEFFSPAIEKSTGVAERPVMQGEPIDMAKGYLQQLQHMIPREGQAEFVKLFQQLVDTPKPDLLTMSPSSPPAEIIAEDGEKMELEATVEHTAADEKNIPPKKRGKKFKSVDATGEGTSDKIKRYGAYLPNTCTSSIPLSEMNIWSGDRTIFETLFLALNDEQSGMFLYPSFGRSFFFGVIVFVSLFIPVGVYWTSSQNFIIDWEYFGPWVRQNQVAPRNDSIRRRLQNYHFQTLEVSILFPSHSYNFVNSVTLSSV